MAGFTLPILLNLVSLFRFAPTGNLIVVVKGIQLQKGGALSTEVFVNESFPKVGEQLFGNETDVTSHEMKTIFDRVADGDYGVVSFQDVDRNKQIKSNLAGYPTESIGFSREAKTKICPRF